MAMELLAQQQLPPCLKRATASVGRLTTGVARTESWVEFDPLLTFACPGSSHRFHAESRHRSDRCRLALEPSLAATSCASDGLSSSRLITAHTRTGLVVHVEELVRQDPCHSALR